MSLLPGDVLKNRNPYDGEGEYIVVEPESDMLSHAKCVMACCEKYPALNGLVTYLSYEAINNYYIKIK